MSPAPSRFGKDRLGDVSVVIPAYRAAGTVGRAIRSIADGTVLPKEIIVVNDGDDPDTAAAVEEASRALTNIEVVVVGQPQAGAGAARNRGLSGATGEFVAFLDADDEWMPGKLERSMGWLAQGDLDLVAHDYVRVDGDNEQVVSCARHFRGGEDPYVSLYKRGYIATSTVVARRQSLLRAGGFDTTLQNAQDFELWLRLLAENDVTYAVFDEPLLRYHVSPSGITSHTDRRLACCLIVARRHYPKVAPHSTLPLLTLWYRIAAVHKEAMAAHRRKSNWMRLLRTAVGFPIALATLTLVTQPPSAPGSNRRLLEPVLWLWLIVAVAAYGYQFRDLVHPLYRLVMTVGSP